MTSKKPQHTQKRAKKNQAKIVMIEPRFWIVQASTADEANHVIFNATQAGWKVDGINRTADSFWQNYEIFFKKSSKRYARKATAKKQSENSPMKKWVSE